ncbi:hypothetical protein MRB56_20000 [Halomonas cupida]|uniref:sarcosine oxidase subunit gamma family protein n=1 Tax=Halomonas cupida TaxID=44933 RepID=UPI0039B3AD21
MPDPQPRKVPGPAPSTVVEGTPATALAGVSNILRNGLCMEVDAPQQILALQGMSPALLDELLDELLDGSEGELHQHQHQHGYWLASGPQRGMLVLESRASSALVERLQQDAGLMVTDVSHGWCRLRLSGGAVRALLQGDISAELSIHAWPPGQGLATAYRGVAVLLYGRAEADIELFVQRSLARSVWQWLEDAIEGANHGLELEPSTTGTGLATTISAEKVANEDRGGLR